MTINCEVACIGQVTKKPFRSSGGLVAEMAGLSVQDAEMNDDIALLIDLAEEAAESEHPAQKLLFQITPETSILFENTIQNKDVESNSLAESASLGSNNLLVAALDDIVERTQTLLTIPLLHPELFNASSGLRPPSGVLLHAPSRVGKSSLALQVA